jgi:cysteine desulfurase/selenocysteine lyase
MSEAQILRDPGAEYDIDRIRADFPILAETMHGKPLTFLDNGASAQKPRQVIDAVSSTYESEYANVHRGAYYLSEKATERYEGSREITQRFLNAASRQEIIFTKNVTEAINLVAFTYARRVLQPGDEIIITDMEHHSNIVPWQLMRDERGLILKYVSCTDDGEFRIEDLAKLITPKTKLISLTHVSNVMGTVVPIKEVAKLAHDNGAKLMVDGAQAIMHLPVDVQDLDCDFYVFTGHKIYGPSGIGVLYGKAELLEAMPPFLGGGDMISTVTMEKSTWAGLPAKFEAGTPPIAQAIGLGAALDYVSGVGLSGIAAHENDLLNYATQELASIDGLRIIGTAPNKTSVISFIMDCAHPHDISTIIDRAGVCVRAGHHCAQPLMERMGVPATTRASFGMYNTREECDTLVAALQSVQELFG